MWRFAGVSETLFTVLPVYALHMIMMRHQEVHLPMPITTSIRR